MRILFVNHSFPGMFGELAAAFGRSGHEAVFVSSQGRPESLPAGVRHLHLPCPETRHGPAGRARDAGRELENALAAGRGLQEAAARLKDEAFNPDMVLASTDGCCLFWEQIFPDSLRVAWVEGASSPGLCRAGGDCLRQLLLCRQAMTSGLFVSLTAGCASFYTASLAHGAELPYAVNTRWFAPDASEKLLHGEADLARARELAVFVAGRGSGHEAGILEACRLLLALRPDCHVALLCGGASSLAALKRQCAAMMPDTVPGRIHLVGRLSLRNYRNLLSLASILVFPAGGNVPPSIMLEAMSCETVLAVPAESEIPELMRDGENIFLARRGSPAMAARSLAALLDDAPALEKMRKNARKTVVDNFDREKVIPRQMSFLLDAWAKWREKRNAESAGKHGSSR